MHEEYRSPIDINFKMPKIPKKAIQGAITVLVAVVLLYGSVYQVSPEEMGVILRFGKYVRTTEPGLHFKLPLGIETLTRVPVQRQLKLEFGFRTTKPGHPVGVHEQRRDQSRIRHADRGPERRRSPSGSSSTRSRIRINSCSR